MADQDASTPTHRKLTEAEWAEAKALYETGKMTKVELSKKFGITRQSITLGLNQRGAVYGSKSKAIEDATIEGQKDESRKRAGEIAEMRERQLKATDMLQRLQNKTIGEALHARKPLASQYDEYKALNALIKNQKMLREEFWEIYDLNRDPDGADEIPEFIVSEYEPDEIRAINNQRLGISPDDGLDEAASALESDQELEALLGDGEGA